jgi:hypothetical protein
MILLLIVDGMDRGGFVGWSLLYWSLSITILFGRRLFMIDGFGISRPWLRVMHLPG